MLHAPGGGLRRGAHGVGGGVADAQACGQGPAVGVAGTGRVHDLRRYRRHLQLAPPGAAGAEGPQHRRCGDPRVLEQLRLVLVDHHGVAGGQHRRGQGSEGREVEDGPGPPVGGELDGRRHDVVLELQRHEQDVAGFEVVELGEVLVSHAVIGAGGDDDHVLAVAVVVDDGRSGGDAGHDLHAGRVHAEGGQPLEVLPPLRVVADLAHEERLGTRPHGRDRLVGTLASEAVLDVPGHHGLARPGMPFHVQVQVLTQRAEHDHSAHVHVLLTVVRAPWPGSPAG